VAPTDDTSPLDISRSEPHFGVVLEVEAQDGQFTDQVPEATPGGMNWDADPARYGDVDIGEERGCVSAAGSNESKAGRVRAGGTLGFTSPELLGSKFRAITRAITHGQPGVITVNRGRARERTPVAEEHKHAGHTSMTCRFSGGQGRGRTADLPIFSRSFEWIHLKNPVEDFVPGNIVDSDVRVS